MKKVRLNKNEKKSAKLIYSLFQKNYYFQKYKNFLQTFTDKIRKHIQYLCNYNIISYTDLFSIFEKLNNNDVLLRSNENFSYLELIRVHQEIEQISQKVGVLSLKDLLFESFKALGLVCEELFDHVLLFYAFGQGKNRRGDGHRM